MKKLAALNLFTAWLALSVALGLFSAPAQAYVYDDFTGPGINPSLWVDRGLDYGLYSQPGDGNLYFSDPTGGQSDSLRSSSSWSVPFFVSMQYANLRAENHASGEFSGSSVNLWIGHLNNTVALYEFIHESTYGFRAVKTVKIGNNTFKTELAETLLTTVDSGWLGINYDGTWVSLWIDAGSGWQPLPMLAPYAPGFTSNPYFGIQGYDPYGESLSFQVNQVQFNPVPLPAGVLLLGSGLLGLAGLGRRFKRN